MKLYKLTYKTLVKGKIKTVEAVKKTNIARVDAITKQPLEGFRTITGKWFYEGDFIKAETIAA